MEINDRHKLHAFIRKTLDQKDDYDEFFDDESLFISRRLDSISVANLVIYLEDELHVNFDDIEIYIELLDSVQAIEKLVDGKAVTQNHTHILSSMSA